VNRLTKLLLLLGLSLAAMLGLYAAWLEPEPIVSQSSHASGRGEWLVYNKAGTRIGSLVLDEGSATWTADPRVQAACDISLGQDGAVTVDARAAIGPLGKRFSLVPGKLAWSISGPQGGLTAITGAPAVLAPAAP